MTLPPRRGGLPSAGPGGPGGWRLPLGDSARAADAAPIGPTPAAPRVTRAYASCRPRGHRRRSIHQVRRWIGAPGVACVLGERAPSMTPALPWGQPGAACRPRRSAAWEPRPRAAARRAEPIMPPRGRSSGPVGWRLPRSLRPALGRAAVGRIGRRPGAVSRAVRTAYPDTDARAFVPRLGSARAAVAYARRSPRGVATLAARGAASPGSPPPGSRRWDARRELGLASSQVGGGPARDGRHREMLAGRGRPAQATPQRPKGARHPQLRGAEPQDRLVHGTRVGDPVKPLPGQSQLLKRTPNRTKSQVRVSRELGHDRLPPCTPHTAHACDGRTEMRRIPAGLRHTTSRYDATGGHRARAEGQARRPGARRAGGCVRPLQPGRQDVGRRSPQDRKRYAKRLRDDCLVDLQDGLASMLIPGDRGWANARPLRQLRAAHAADRADPTKTGRHGVGRAIEQSRTDHGDRPPWVPMGGQTPTRSAAHAASIRCVRPGRHRSPSASFAMRSGSRARSPDRAKSRARWPRRAGWAVDARLRRRIVCAPLGDRRLAVGAQAGGAPRDPRTGCEVRVTTPRFGLRRGARGGSRSVDKPYASHRVLPGPSGPKPLPRDDETAPRGRCEPSPLASNGGCPDFALAAISSASPACPRCRYANRLRGAGRPWGRSHGPLPNRQVPAAATAGHIAMGGRIPDGRAGRPGRTRSARRSPPGPLRCAPKAVVRRSRFGGQAGSLPPLAGAVGGPRGTP